MPLLPTAPVRIQPYFGYRSHDRLIVAARALRSVADDFAATPGIGTGRWRALRTMIAQFASHEVSGLPVELEIARADGTRHRHMMRTDAEGYARFNIALDPSRDYAARPVWENVTFHWHNRKGAQSTSGHVLAPGRETSLAVISDIDDTIIETGVTGGFRSVWRNWRRILVQLPQDRLLVPQADMFYAALGGGLTDAEGSGAAGQQHPATIRPFFYISSSPWNLYSYLVAFKRERGLPLGPVLLRDWGLNRATFGSGSHGDHKRAAIDGLLTMYPTLQFALVGDDTQGDLTAYAAVVAANPGRIRAVFIRTLGEAMTPHERAAKAAIESAGVPLWLGGDYVDGQRFLASAGLLHDEGAQRIVATVEQAKAAKE